MPNLNIFSYIATADKCIRKSKLALWQSSTIKAIGLLMSIWTLLLIYLHTTCQHTQKIRLWQHDHDWFPYNPVTARLSYSIFRHIALRSIFLAVDCFGLLARQRFPSLFIEQYELIWASVLLCCIWYVSYCVLDFHFLSSLYQLYISRRLIHYLVPPPLAASSMCFFYDSKFIPSPHHSDVDGRGRGCYFVPSCILRYRTNDSWIILSFSTMVIGSSVPELCYTSMK